MSKSVNVSARAQAKGRSKKGGTDGGADWSHPWSRTQALAELCVPPEAYESTLNLRQRIETELEEALAGQTARLSNDHDLGEHRALVLEAIALVRQQMLTIGLNASQRMYPVLWIRLLLEAGIVLKGHVYRQLGEWRLRCEAEGAVVFALVTPSAKNPRVTTKIVPGGSHQKYARTVEELLLRPAVRKGSPYNQTWKLLVMPRAEPVAQASITASASAKNPAAEAKKKLRRRKKTIEHLNKLCGSGTMEKLAAALKREAGSSRGLVMAESDSHYSTKLSATELCETLKRHQSMVRKYSDSTLRKALGAYVTLPRGRPPRKSPLIQKMR